MLNVVKIAKSVYDNLDIDTKMRAETMFLCKNEENGLCSIYVGGLCYGEDIDEDKFLKDNDIYDWAKEPEKPEYTAKEVGAVDEDDVISQTEIDLMFLKIFG